MLNAKPSSSNAAANTTTIVTAVTNPVAAARAASLRYVTDTAPGIARKRNGIRFVYIAPGGKTIRDPAQLKRIQSLVIPPAWTDVWICALEDGHLQATGRDAKGRKQHRYHPRWREIRDATKYHRMIAFAAILPRIRGQVQRDLSLPGLPREKVLATVVRLLEVTAIRVGNEEYARKNGSFGLATLKNRHVDVSGGKIRFQFRGKSGVQHAIDLQDKRLAKIIKRCQDLPGYELFKYIDDDGELCAIDANDVNDYLKQIAGEDFTTKDFRTWNGTVLAACALKELKCAEGASKAQLKRNIVQAVESVAKRLGNTKAVCRKCYIHPAVIEAYEAGSLVRGLRVGMPRKETAGEYALGVDEAAVAAFLRRQAKLGRNGKTVARRARNVVPGQSL
jgi:DNA topoisomerase-1